MSENTLPSVLPVTPLTPVELRQLEVDAYTNNIAVYSAIIVTLDGVWDADLIQYKGVNHHDAARDCPFNRVERLAELQQFDHFSGLIKTEMIERAKANSILTALKAQV